MAAYRKRDRVIAASVLGLSALLVLAGPATADDDDAAEAALDLVCVPAGANVITLTAALKPGGGGAEQVPPELIVEKIYFEVHSEPGGFWIQLKQSVLPRMTFDICAILREAGIESADLDAARFYLQGETLGTENPEDVEGRCENFPPPGCPPAD